MSLCPGRCTQLVEALIKCDAFTPEHATSSMVMPRARMSPRVIWLFIGKAW
jgi:hypothetical protein